jgi:hypothetical protein
LDVLERTLLAPGTIDAPGKIFSMLFLVIPSKSPGMVEAVLDGGLAP